MQALPSVQLFALGHQTSDHPMATVARLADMGFGAVEPVVMSGRAPNLARVLGDVGIEADANALPRPVDLVALRAALDHHDLVVSACHGRLPEGRSANAVLDEHELLGTPTLVVAAAFDAERGAMETFDDLDRIKKWAERFNAAADLARSRGIAIGYHNHFWEFGASFDGRSGLEVFFDLCEPDIVAEVDVYWAQIGGRDPVELITSLGERVTMLHLKDGDGQVGTPTVALGSGVVGIDEILDAASFARWHVLEPENLDESAVWPALEDGYEYLAARAR